MKKIADQCQEKILAIARNQLKRCKREIPEARSILLNSLFNSLRLISIHLTYASEVIIFRKYVKIDERI